MRGEYNDKVPGRILRDDRQKARNPQTWRVRPLGHENNNREGEKVYVNPGISCVHLVQAIRSHHRGGRSQ